jgi:hypothetical protein
LRGPSACGPSATRSGKWRSTPRTGRTVSSSVGAIGRTGTWRTRLGRFTATSLCSESAIVRGGGEWQRGTQPLRRGKRVSAGTGGRRAHRPHAPAPQDRGRANALRYGRHGGSRTSARRTTVFGLVPT